jgi:nicotinamide mononucleotide transporter
MSLIEWIAAGLGVLNVALIVRRSVWNYPVALVMVTLYTWVFWQTKLYSDAGLQLFFFAANVAGWLIWWRAAGNDGMVQVRRLPLLTIAGYIAVSLVATIGWGHFMALNTDASAPYWDASVAMLSVIGQFLMMGRYLESWYWWIAVNILSIGLYWTKALYPTVGLASLLLGLAIYGLLEWQHAERSQTT